MDLHFKSMPGTFNVDEALGIVECFVAAVGNKDSVGDIVMPGAFTDSLRHRKPRVVWGHDWNQPIGKVLEIYEVPPSDPRLPAKMKAAGVGGLYARVQFNLKSERGREAFNSITFFGEEQEWSIGYKTLDSIYSQERAANLLKTVELYEVSPVLHGANQLTGTISIKSEQQKEDQVDSFRKSKWKTFDPDYAEMIRTKHPEIWSKGGNIKGNDQYRALLPIYRRGGKATSQAEINALELREAWVARHADDHLLAGVVAQIKWLAVGSRGEGYMKNLINDYIKKTESKSDAMTEVKAGKPQTGSFVRWTASGGTAYGKVTKIVNNGTVSAQPTGPSMKGTAAEPAAQVRVYRLADGSWEATNTVTVHRLGSLTAIDQLPSATQTKQTMMTEGADAKCLDPNVMSLIEQLVNLLSGNDAESEDADQADEYDFSSMLDDLRNTAAAIHSDMSSPDGEDPEEFDVEGDTPRSVVRRVFSMPAMAKGDCGCGCGGAGTCSTGKKDALGEAMAGSGKASLATSLSEILGRVVAFYFKSHASHWNVEGTDFSQYHELFGQIYADVQESIDAWAENIRKLGYPTPGSLFDFGMQQIEFPKSETAASGALARALYVDNEALIVDMKNAFDLANSLNEQGIANFIAERIDQHQKWSWFLSASLKNAEIKSIIAEIETKAGRVIADRNMQRLRQALDLLRQVVEEGDPHTSMQMKSGNAPTEYLFIDATPQSMFNIKSFLDDFAEYHGAEVVVDEDGGEWIAIEAKSDEMMNVVLDFFEPRQSEFQIKGFAYGESELDEDVKVKHLPFDYSVKGMRGLASAYDPDAVDGDDDGRVQDGTQWERPASPRAQKLGAEARKIRSFMSENNYTAEDLTDAISGAKTPRGKKLAEELNNYDPASARGALELLTKPKRPKEGRGRLATIAEMGRPKPEPEFRDFNMGLDPIEAEMWLHNNNLGYGTGRKPINREEAEARYNARVNAGKPGYDWLGNPTGAQGAGKPSGTAARRSSAGGVPNLAGRPKKRRSDDLGTKDSAFETIRDALLEWDPKDPKNDTQKFNPETFLEPDGKFIGETSGLDFSNVIVHDKKKDRLGIVHSITDGDPNPRAEDSGAVNVVWMTEKGKPLPVESLDTPDQLSVDDIKDPRFNFIEPKNLNLEDFVEEANLVRGDGYDRADVPAARMLNGVVGMDALKSMRPVAGPLGSQGGRWFEGPSVGGQKPTRYLVKPAKSEAHAKNELAAHLWLKSQGVPTDETGIFQEDGKWYIVKRGLKDSKGDLPQTIGTDGMTPELQREARAHFVTDALASSWDVFGLNGDNVLIGSSGEGDANQLHRIDVGGSFRFRAQGGDKTSFAPDEPWVEPFTMRDSAQGRAFYGDISDATLAGMLESTYDKFRNPKGEEDPMGEFKQSMLDAGIDEQTASQITDTLNSRIDQIPQIVDKLDVPSESKTPKEAQLKTPVSGAELEGTQKELNASLSQFWGSVSSGGLEPQPIANEEDGTSKPSWGFHASPDGSTLAYVAPFPDGTGRRNDVAVAVVRRDGKNVDVPDVFVLRGQQDGRGTLDAESTKILTDVLGEETVTGSPGGINGYASDNFIRSFVGQNPTYANEDIVPNPETELVKPLEGLLSKDSTPFLPDEEIQLRDSWNGSGPNPFEPNISSGATSQDGSVDEQTWKQQYDSLQKYFAKEIGPLPKWSDLSRRDLEQIMSRFSRKRNPERTKTEAMLQLLAHYQWLYAKD